MTWEGFTNWLTDISHNPVFISVVSILCTIAGGLVIIGRTSVGRKAINKLTELGRNTQNKVSEIKNFVNSKEKELDEKVSEFKVATENFVNTMDEKFKVFTNMFSFYETEMIELIKLIPNAKVQAKVKEIEEGWTEKKKEIEKYVGITYDEVNEKFADLEKQIEELKNGRNDNPSESEEI